MYAVVTPIDIVEVTRLPMGTLSQKAELIALTRASQVAKGQQANSYTDFKNVFFIAHTHPALWKERGFLTTKGTSIVKGPLITNLLEAVQCPAKVAIIHCRGHQSSKDLVALGNAKVDSVARGLASSSSDSTEHILFLPLSYQPCYQPKEKGKLIKRGAQRMDSSI